MPTLSLSLHPKQLEIYTDPAQLKALCAGRGFGKSVLLLTSAIAFCIGFDKEINPISPQKALICMPTLKMARDIHWKPLLSLCEQIPLVSGIDRSNFVISFYGDRPDLKLMGADLGGDRLRGLNLIWAGLDEFQDFQPDVWVKAIRPALSRNQGWKALVIGTPKGKDSYFYEFCQNARKEEANSYYHATTVDNPFIDPEEVEAARRELPPKTFRQEYLASWEDFDGQIFSEIDRRYISPVDPGEYRATFLTADWGDVNPCLMAIGLTHQGVYYLIDHWQGDGSTPVPEQLLAEKAAAMAAKHGASQMFLPDDRPASIVSFRGYGKRHNSPALTKATRVTRSNPGIFERMSIINSLFYQGRMYFTPATEHLYERFASFHSETDRWGRIGPAPAKGQDQHGIDAVSYCIGMVETRFGSRLKREIQRTAS